MRAKFWLERWQKNEIGFHQPDHNQLLKDFWPCTGLLPGDPVFVPLCGKSLDMRWLEHAGHPVVGVELAQIAVETYFAERGEVPRSDVVDRFARYRCGDTTIYQGDIFDLTAPLLEGVKGLFDRGALVALPPDMRFRYVDHLLRIIPDGVKMLLLALEYEQALLPGPPHAVHPEEVQALFGARCEIVLLDSIVTESLPPRFAQNGVRQAVESVYLMTKRD